MQTEVTHPLAFLLKVEQAHTFGETLSYRIEAVAVEVRPDGPYGLAYAYGDRKGLGDLTVSALININDPNDREWWGWDVTYRDLHHVTLTDVEAMYQKMRLIERKLAAKSKVEGQPVDLFSYLVRVATALGIKQYVMEADPRYAEMHGTKWRNMSASELQWQLREIVNAKRKEHSK